MAQLVVAANNHLVGIAKQTNGTTPATNAIYSLPVYASELDGRFELNRVEVTDAASLQGDPFKTPSFWQGNGISFPAFAAQMGAFLQSLWPTDTITGAGPYTHTFSGLGGTQSWYSLFHEWPSAAATERRFSGGLGSYISFAGDSGGGPLRISYNAMGTTYENLSYTAGTTALLSDGWFQLQLASSTIELDYDTPNVNPSVAATWIRSYEITVEREVTAEPTADAFTVSNLGQGRVICGGTLEMLYNSWDAYNATHFGAVAGTAQSPTIVYGALDLNFKHTVQAGWTFELYVPKVMFTVGPVVPNPDGSALTQPVTLNIATPAAGSPVQPILVNAVTPAY
jgi:hypothetical protein